MTAGTLLYTQCHIASDITGNPGGNRLLQKYRRDCFYSSAITVKNLCHKMRLIIISAIDNGTHRIDFLDHGTGKTLSKSRTCKFCFPHTVLSMDNTCAFIRQVNPCPCSEIKQTLCFDKLSSSHLGTNLHHCIITGVCNYLSQCLCAMCARINRTLDHSISKSLRSIAYKCICFLYRTFFQCRSHDDRLYNRSRLIGICDAEITPHTIQSLHCFHIIHRFDFIFCIYSGKISRIIQIITVTTIHGNNLTGGRIFNNDTYILGPHCLFKSINIFLNNLLCTDVNAGLNAFSIHRSNNGLLHI